MDTLRLIRPDDWHIHLRDGDVLPHTVGDAARTFARAIAMPNLNPPIISTEDALAYRDRIRAARPAGSDFEPLMTLYLTDNTPPAEIQRAKASGHIVAAKLYPAGATTNSDAGVTDLARIDDVLAAMAEEGLLLLVHGEVTRDAVDVFDREHVFIEEQLAPLVARHPSLRVVFEHITTAEAVRFVTAASDNVGATITVHHLQHTRNDMLVGGIRPHLYCLPILKGSVDREALIAAATGDNERFFLGTDSAPHARHRKETGCGCAGSYTAHAALEFYAEIFEEAGALNQLEAFASTRGPDFYALPRNTDTVTLVRAPQSIPATLPFSQDVVVPHRAGGTTRWSLRHD
jgi:dihydroorotase